MSKRIKILTPRIYEHSDFFHNAYDFARKKSLNTNELCLELSRYLVEHFDEVWKIERPRIYKQICDLQSQLQQANEIINNPDTLIFQQQQLIDNLKSQLAEKEKVSPKSSIKEIVKRQDIKCFFRDKTLAQIQKCGDVYSPEYGYFNFEDDYDELLNNKKDDRFDIVAIEVIKTTKSSN